MRAQGRAPGYRGALAALPWGEGVLERRPKIIRAALPSNTRTAAASRHCVGPGSGARSYMAYMELEGTKSIGSVIEPVAATTPFLSKLTEMMMWRCWSLAK